MGGQISRPNTGTEVVAEKMRFQPELKAYEQACKLDPDVRNFDTALHERTGRAITALASGVEVSGMTLDSLREVTTTMLEMDQDVVKILLECKNDIWGHTDLFELVEEYFANSLLTLDFCTLLESCLRKARDNQLIIQVALQQVEDGAPSEAQLAKMLEELGNFKKAENPFSEDLFKHFQELYQRHMKMLEKLQAKKGKLDKKLKNIKVWRKVSSVIFGATFVSVLICSVVAAAILAPPVAAALAAAVPIASMGKWVINLLKKFEETIKMQQETIATMQIQTFVVIKELDTIRNLVDRLEETIESIIRTVDFCLKDDAAVRIGIEDIKKKHDTFMKEIDDLGTYVNRCSEKIRKARTLVVIKMIRPDRKRSFSF